MTTQKQVGVYILQNDETLETYVGSGNLPERKKNHFSELRNNRHSNKRLQDAYNRSQNFEFIGIPIEDREEAYVAEQTIINEHVGNPLLLNVVLDVNEGVPRGWNHSQESIEKMRLAKIGKALSEEHKQKVSQSLIGNTRSLGFKHSSETIEKRRISQLGHVVTEETREKMRKSLIGRVPHENTLKHSMTLAKPLIANGVEYNSLSEAARIFKVDVGTIRNRIKSKNFDNWKYV